MFFKTSKYARSGLPGLLPSAGLVYQPLDWLSLYGSYSESFRPNASTSDGDGPFDPEEGVGIEAGVKASLLDDQLLATFSVFNIDKKNVLVTENNVTSAVGEVQSRGIEFDLSGQVTPELQLVATYTMLDSEVTENGGVNEGKRFVGAPEHTASLFGTYRFLDGPLTGFSIGGGLIYVGDRAVDAANEFFLDEYVVADASIAYEDQIENGPSYRIQLTAKNITDEETFPYSFGTFRVGVGRPREVFLSASVRF